MTHDPYHHQCRHLPMRQLQRQIMEDIARQSFSVRHVLSDGVHPDFTYTVGLHGPHSPFPELFVSGLSMETREGFMLSLGFTMKGPPPFNVQQRLAWDHGVSVADLTFPVGKGIFEPGRIYRQYSNNGLPMFFGRVDQGYYDEILGQAVVFHGHASFPALQMVWSDRRGRFPFELRYATGPRFAQRMLFDPQQYLPLKETRFARVGGAEEEGEQAYPTQAGEEEKTVKCYTLAGTTLVERESIVADLHRDLQDESRIFCVGPFDGRALWVRKDGGVLRYQIIGAGGPTPRLALERSYGEEGDVKTLLLDTFFAVDLDGPPPTA